MRSAAEVGPCRERADRVLALVAESLNINLEKTPDGYELSGADCN